MMVMKPISELDDKSQTWRFFDLIAGRYDVLNRVLSLGIDVYWRRCMHAHLLQNNKLSFLDLATGTGDVIDSFVKRFPDSFDRIVGLDMSQGMLDIGKVKLKKYASPNIEMIRGDACKLPFDDASFDLVTMSFGIRNVPDVDACLKEMLRILKPGGQAMVLEFALPQNRAFRACYLFYFRYILPRVGALFSGHGYAYRYLNASVESFPYGQAFSALMTAAGFKKNVYKMLSLGIACLYVAEKPKSD